MLTKLSFAPTCRCCRLSQVGISKDWMAPFAAHLMNSSDPHSERVKSPIAGLFKHTNELSAVQQLKSRKTSLLLLLHLTVRSFLKPDSSRFVSEVEWSTHTCSRASNPTRPKPKSCVLFRRSRSVSAEQWVRSRDVRFPYDIANDVRLGRSGAQELGFVDVPSEIAVKLQRSSAKCFKLCCQGRNIVEMLYTIMFA